MKYCYYGSGQLRKAGNLALLRSDPAKQLEFKENFSSTFLEAFPEGTEPGGTEA